MATDPEESTVNCVDAWVAKLLDGKTLAESEVVQLCSKVWMCFMQTVYGNHGPIVEAVVAVVA